MKQNKFFTLVLLLVSGTCLWAQRVLVDRSSEKVRGESADGYRTELTGAAEIVASAWSKYIKELGKGKGVGDYIAIAQPALGGTVYEKGVVYAKVTGRGPSATVWLGLIESAWSVNDISLVYKELEQAVYRFGVKFYRDQIQLQIDEAQQAVDAVERSQTRLLSQNKDLSNKLTNNESEKIRLEKQLENNQLEHAALLTRLETNRKAQDSVAAAMIPIKKILESHQERQRKVN